MNQFQKMGIQPQRAPRITYIPGGKWEAKRQDTVKRFTSFTNTLLWALEGK